MVGKSQNVGLNLDYMQQSAGFSLSHQWLTDFDPTSTRTNAYLIGILNTLRLIVVGIVLATLLGTIMGVARLSSNWLVSTIATVYIEVIRNTPLLIQLFFWYFAVFLKLPEILDGPSAFDTFFLSNRGFVLPSFTTGGLAWLFGLLLVAGAVAGLYVRHRQQKIEDATGIPSHQNLYGLATFLGIGLVAFVATGLPLGSDFADIVVSDTGVARYEGGLVVTPEFTAVMVALVLYTGSFIAEIVRGSIQALPKGQTEAAMAIGLSQYQRMTLVILPQALRTIIPPLTNQYLNLTKNSSLAVTVAYADLVFVGTLINNKAGQPVPMFLVILATYMAMNYTISVFMNYMNSRVQLVGR
jgi:general L-amino acid transport system permease protein